VGKARTFEDWLSTYLTMYPEASDLTVQRELWERNQRLRSALERSADNLRRMIAGKPVRDAAATFAEADGALRD